jgi:hypothetical protein
MKYVDSRETDRVLSILENLEDGTLSINLLREFSEKNKQFGKILLNRNENLDHEDWKRQCDQAKKEMDEFLVKVESLCQ